MYFSHSFPSRFVIGRSRGEAMADRRKDELNGYVWHLIHAAQEVAQVTFGPTFIIGLYKSEKYFTNQKCELVHFYKRFWKTAFI